MSKFQSPLINSKEADLAKESGARKGKLGSAWDLGIWLGRSTRTNEHLVGTRLGVIRARTVKRRPETLKWDRELYGAMKFVPWSIDDPVVTAVTGWEPASGCKACDEEKSAVKRRNRPFNHAPECDERQADFRARLREKKVLSAGDASSLSATVLDLSIGTDPLLSGPSVQAEYLSSCFEVVAQPMTVELGTSVSRGLKRGLESGDMEIAAANEESHSSQKRKHGKH